jgi:hypothetical protein
MSSASVNEGTTRSTPPSGLGISTFAKEVHGALAFYLAHQREIDAYLMEDGRTAQSQHGQSRKTNAELIAKFQRARNASQISG